MNSIMHQDVYTPNTVLESWPRTDMGARDHWLSSQAVRHVFANHFVGCHICQPL